MRHEMQENGITVEPVEEPSEEIQKFANQEEAALFAFVAPYSGVRVNPMAEAYATIGVQEEFGVESFIERCRQARVKRLRLLVNSPGGGVVSSYKIAQALRSQFDDIRVFVPHMAASGGTLIALTGNEIVMGIMSHLSPLDPQVPYKGMSISSNSFLRCFERFTKYYGQLQPGEAPYPIRCMTEKLDPLVMEEMSGSTATCVGYVVEVLQGAGYDEDDAFDKASLLTTKFHDHTTVLRREWLREHGFKVVADTKHQKDWEKMRQWLKNYIGKSECVHHMRYCLPNAKKTAGTARAVLDSSEGGPERRSSNHPARRNGKNGKPSS